MSKDNLIKKIKKLIEKLKFNESKLLLNDGIKTLESELYFASLGIFVTFIEKYLRDILILKEFKINPSNEEGLLKFDKIEKDIESGKREYNFEGICDSLVKYNFFDEGFNEKLISTYKNLRIPVHHGIYKRLVNYQNNGYKGIIQKIELLDNGEFITEDLEIEQSNILIRDKVLPEIFEYYSFELLSLIVEILEME